MGPSASERKHDIQRYVQGTEVWSLNNAYLKFPQLCGGGFSRFFELHGWEYLANWSAGEDPESGSKVDHWANLARLGCTIYTGQHIPLVQDQVQVDWEAVWTHFYHKIFKHVTGAEINCYFLGSPSVMLAIALYEHDMGQTVEFIQSLGIDTSDPRHCQQRQSWSFWVSQALARGIEIGGTAASYMLEYEKDDGLRGLREKITTELNARIPKTGPVTDYAVCTYCTPSEEFPGVYEKGFNRLKSWCRKNGLRFCGKIEQTPQEISDIQDAVVRNRARRSWILSRKPVAVKAALEKTGKPVFFLDCDDEFLGVPSFPECDIGFLRNPEKELPSTAFTHLVVASTGIIAPTEAGNHFVNRWIALCKDAAEHRAYQMAWTELCTRSGTYGIFADVTAHMTGLYKIHAAPNGHRLETKTYGIP